jgi:hypothetical protein
MSTKRQEIVPIRDNSAETLLATAVEKGADVNTLERLLAMRKELKAEQAREAFYKAMSEFQSSCPIIKKERKVRNKDGGIRYIYANLDDIVTVVAPLLSEHGLSYGIKAELRDGAVVANCIVNHMEGHSEESSFAVPIEKEAFMGDAQKSGSALMYAKRYAFCNAFGIVTGDEDDDGKALGGGVSVQDLYRRFVGITTNILKYYDAIMLIKDSIAKEDYAPGAETWYQIPDEDKRSLWAAPTKGGPFTREERLVIKTNKWAEAYFGKAIPKEATMEDEE